MNMPKLRFPEFRDAGEWEKGELKNLGELLPGLTYSPEDVREKGLLVLRSSNVQNGEICLEDNVYVNPEVKGASLSKPNDILICVRNGSKSLIGKNALLPEGMPLCTHGAFMTVFRSQSAKFVFQLFQTSDYQSQVDADLGATINSINGSHFIKYKFYIPLPKEQQKIADCLASIDLLITTETQKLDTLKVHKKGLMQQLFPAETETIPKLRFPEFRDAEDWEEYQFGKLIKVNSGKGFKASEYCKNGIRLLQIENVGYGATKWNGNTIYLPQDYLTEYSELVLREGNIVLALNRPVTNDELKIAQLQKEDEPSILYQRVGKLELLSDSIVRDFVFHIRRIFIKEFVVKQSIGSDQPFISVTTLYSQIILIPSPDEQQKLADCLSSLDELITAHSQKLDTLKTHKKGMMQQLFPVLDEVKP